MELSEIKQLNHRKQQINITNSNNSSIYEEIIFKISIDVADNEIVRFSLEPNDEFLQHQSIDNDYFIRIPNRLNTTFPIYVHYFAADLYEYEEDTEIFSIYDLSQLATTNNDTFNGQPVLQITSNGYEVKLGDDNKPYIRSLLSSTINDKYKNPNYKNYIYSDIPLHMTQQGMFPLSSRYRSMYAYLTAPNVQENPNAFWQGQLSSSYNCHNDTTRPFWEAKIHRTLLSPLITEGVDNAQTLEDFNLSSLNVFLNYQYLPTSTEYHQHYFGFEGKLQTRLSDFNVFEHTNLHTLNSNFNSINNYNIINYGNVTDNKHGINVPHIKKINLSLQDFINNTHNCTFEKNICDDYFIYTPLNDNNYTIKNIKLKNNAEYVLKYYIYIPTETFVEDDSCYIQIQRTYDVEEDIDGGTQWTTATEFYKLDNIFLKQDKVLRNQWIYHEIPFIGSENIQIQIIGPQHGNDEHLIFFCNLEIYENIEYTPTLKYTNTGLFLMESTESTFKPIKEENNNNCEPVSYTELPWSNTQTKLPTPHGNINIRMSNDIDIYYDNFVTNLSYNGPNYYRDNSHQLHNNDVFWLSYESLYDPISGQLIWNNTEDTQLSYDKETGILSFKTHKDNKKIFTKGPGNWFILQIEDSYRQSVTIGEIECAIFNQKTYDLHATPIKYIGKKKINNVGTVYFNNINLSSLEVVDNKPTRYYLRIVYTSRCTQKTKIFFKSIFLEPQQIYGKVYINDVLLPNDNKYIVQSNEDIPLKVDLFLYNQINNIIDIGYCELSIEDVVTQTTIVDPNGRSDFYLNFQDLPKKTNRIKIVYYNKYFIPILWVYFDIIIPDTIDRRDAIPIIIKDLQNATEVIFDEEDYVIDNDDAVLMCIDVHNHQNFKLEVTKNGIYEINENIYDNNDDIILVDTDTNHEDIQKINHYVITTKSIDNNGPYRTTNRILNIIRRPKDIGTMNIEISVDIQEFNHLSDVATFTARALDEHNNPVSNLLLQFVEEYNDEQNIIFGETNKQGYAVFYATPHEMNTITYYVQNIKTTTVPYGKSESITLAFNKIIIQQSIEASWNNRTLNLTFTNKQPNQNILLQFNNGPIVSINSDEENLDTISMNIPNNIDATNTTITLQQYEDSEYIYSGATIYTHGPGIFKPPDVVITP